ncbi:MAG: hypothetical protein DCC52_18350 [Chloroflexi bacterium]|nr:MAG: hypothetical protein DCC52_18350 [Chloroflexota bacterium]
MFAKSATRFALVSTFSAASRTSLKRVLAGSASSLVFNAALRAWNGAIGSAPPAAAEPLAARVPEGLMSSSLGIAFHSPKKYGTHVLTLHTCPSRIVSSPARGFNTHSHKVARAVWARKHIETRVFSTRFGVKLLDAFCARSILSCHECL